MNKLIYELTYKPLNFCKPRTSHIYVLSVPCAQPLYMHLERIMDLYNVLGCSLSENP